MAELGERRGPPDATNQRESPRQPAPEGRRQEESPANQPNTMIATTITAGVQTILTTWAIEMRATVIPGSGMLKLL